MSFDSRSLVPCLLLVSACARPVDAAPEPPPSAKGTAANSAAGSPAVPSTTASPSASAPRPPIVRDAKVSGAAAIKAEFSVASTVAVDPRIDDPLFGPALAALAHPLAIRQEQKQDLAAVAAAEKRWAAFAGPSGKRAFPFEPTALPVTIRITNTSANELLLVDPKSDDASYAVEVTSGAYIGVLGETDLSLKYFAGTPVKLGPGASMDVQQPTLKFGERAARCGIYFTKPGPATVELTFVTAIVGPNRSRTSVMLLSGPIGIEVTK